MTDGATPPPLSKKVVPPTSLRAGYNAIATRLNLASALRSKGGVDALSAREHAKDAERLARVLENELQRQLDEAEERLQEMDEHVLHERLEALIARKQRAHADLAAQMASHRAAVAELERLQRVHVERPTERMTAEERSQREVTWNANPGLIRYAEKTLTTTSEGLERAKRELSETTARLEEVHALQARAAARRTALSGRPDPDQQRAIRQARFLRHLRDLTIVTRWGAYSAATGGLPPDDLPPVDPPLAARGPRSPQREAHDSGDPRVAYALACVCAELANLLPSDERSGGAPAPPKGWRAVLGDQSPSDAALAYLARSMVSSDVRAQARDDPSLEHLRANAKDRFDAIVGPPPAPPVDPPLTESSHRDAG